MMLALDAREGFKCNLIYCDYLVVNAVECYGAGSLGSHSCRMEVMTKDEPVKAESSHEQVKL